MSPLGIPVPALTLRNLRPCDWFAETARGAGAANPEQLGEQLALLLDGASARTRVLNTDTFPTAAAIAAVLIDNAIPTAAQGGVRGGIRSAPVRVAGERQPG
jgi:hypothetical protein